MKRYFMFGGILFIAASIFIYSGLSVAGTATGKIHQVAVVKDATGARKVGFVILDAGVHKDAPSCASIKGRFAMDLNTAEGRASYATAMAAWLAGISVEIVGGEGPDGVPNCNVWGDTETAYYFYTAWQP